MIQTVFIPVDDLAPDLLLVLVDSLDDGTTGITSIRSSFLQQRLVRIVEYSVVNHTSFA